MGPARLSRLTTSAVLCCTFSLVASHASAQYFGRNKVQYDSSRVLVHATEHFDIYHASEDTAAAQMAGRMAERWHARLSEVLQHTLRGRQPIVLYGSHRRFEQTNVYGGFIDESTGGFTDARKRRIVLPFAGSLAETDHVLGHEIVHAFQFDIADAHRSPLFVPLWFVEGMAEYLTLGPGDPHTAMWMRDAVASGELPGIRDLGSRRYFPYRWGAALWAHLVEEYGDDLPARALRARRDVSRRLHELTGRTLDELTADWHASLRTAHAAPPSEVRRDEPLLSSKAGGGRLNLAASLSPDGQRVVFLSERDQFSIDLFLAEAETGRIIRKLITTAANPELESLQYLHSAGTWDPSGTRFALATVVGGRASLLVIGVDDSRRTTRHPVAEVDEIFSPTWSPDGRAVAFSAIRSGFSDLFVLDLASGAVRRLTSDAYADLQPAWSPDGRTLAFTTDRFTTSLSALTYGHLRIGLLDIETGAIVQAPAIPGANHLDPSWKPGGRALYVVADPDGVRNVYRLEEGQAHQLTDIATGVSGVTRTSPALSVASRRGTVAFSVFHRAGYEVHTLDPGVPPVATLAASARPPADPARVLEDILPVPGLPTLAAAAVPTPGPTPYKPKLSLEGIGTPFFSAGGGPIGGYVSGGTSLLFGDLLGDEQLFTSVYVSSRLNESAFATMYINRRARWNWGATMEQTPELRLRTSDVRVTAEGDRVVSRDRDRTLWINRQVGAFAAYPFSRTRRVEISGGVRQIGSALERRTEIVSPVSGLVVDHQRQSLPGEPAVSMAEAGVALVGDSAVFGATGPMLGSRYRLQTSATVGDLKYAGVLADYRRYLMPVRPYTLAFRIVHTGRYGADAGDLRLRDIYVGSPSLVRGYGPRQVARAECPAGAYDCPALNSLLASRIVAAKAELRVPLWSTLRSTSQVRYGTIPLDAFVFADAGAGWGGERRFGPGGTDGRIVRSVGGGVRANLIGMVLEVAAIRPLDLRRAGWTLGINLTPAF
jgi:hypothetical protein